MAVPESLTGQFMSGKRKIEVPKQRVPANPEKVLKLTGARGNNLKDVTLTLPVGLFTCITGVSGSGKSTLINDTLFPIAQRQLNGATIAEPAPYRDIQGLEHFDKVIDIDQSPIGRTPRSNPATYTGVFTPVRELFAGVPESRSRGYTPGRFSFNVRGGRCEACGVTASLRLRCTSCRISTCRATSAKANAITVKRWRLSTRVRPSTKCWI